MSNVPLGAKRIQSCRWQGHVPGWWHRELEEVKKLMIVQINIHSAPVSLSTIQCFQSGVNYWLFSQNQMR